MEGRETVLVDECVKHQGQRLALGIQNWANNDATCSGEK